LTYFFDRGVSVVVLGNLSVARVAPSAEIAGYLGALAHGDTVQLMSEKAITLAPSLLARYAGVYQFAAGQTMTIASRADSSPRSRGAAPRCRSWPSPRLASSTATSTSSSSSSVTARATSQSSWCSRGRFRNATRAK
jgi:hypothetical protein